MDTPNAERLFTLVASAVMALAVAAGAFGAHGLRDRLSPADLDIFETAVRYQMVHGLALLAVAWGVTRFPGAWIAAAGWLFVVGIVVFSGSLYLLVLTDTRWLGAVTPIGGVAMILGWIALFGAAFRS